MNYLGDFPEDQTVHFKWNTCEAGGASVTRATDGALWVYKDDATGTEVQTGITDTEDHDGNTGVHHCKIVTTDGFYAAGCDYFVVLKEAVIDGETVNAEIAHFSIENRFMRGTDSAALATACTEARLAKLTSLAFTGTDVQATLDGEEVVTDAASRTASKADVSACSTHSASDAKDAVLNATAADHVGAGTIGKAMADTLADTNELQVDDLPGLIAALNDFDPASDKVALGNVAHGGAAATIEVESISVLNDSGDAVQLVSGGGGGVGLLVTSVGVLPGMRVKGLGTGASIDARDGIQGDLIASGGGATGKVAGVVGGVDLADDAITADGKTLVSILEAVMAVISGKTAPSGSDVPFMKRDGVTAKVTNTYGATQGQRTASAWDDD